MYGFGNMIGTTRKPIFDFKNVKQAPTSASLMTPAFNFAELGHDFPKIFDDDESHRYLGRLLITSAATQPITKFRKRIRAAWTACLLRNLNLRQFKNCHCCDQLTN